MKDKKYNWKFWNDYVRPKQKLIITRNARRALESAIFHSDVESSAEFLRSLYPLLMCHCAEIVLHCNWAISSSFTIKFSGLLEPSDIYHLHLWFWNLCGSSWDYDGNSISSSLSRLEFSNFWITFGCLFWCLQNFLETLYT